MDASQSGLLELGVPGERLHTERFNMVQGGFVRRVQMTRLVWIIAVLLVIACLVFAAARG